MPLPFLHSLSSFIIPLFIMSKRPCDSSDSSASKRTKVVRCSDLSSLIESKGLRLFPPCDFCTRSNLSCFHSSDSVRCSTCVRLQRSCSSSVFIRNLYQAKEPQRLVDMRSLAGELREKHACSHLSASFLPIHFTSW